MDERAALQIIADGDRLPCRDCKRVHPQRESGDRTTWADPHDGHVYREITAAEFATMVLDDTLPVLD